MSAAVGLLWLAVAFLLSVVVGVAGGILSRMAGHGLAEAVITGAVAFAGSAGLSLAVLGFALTYVRWR